MGITYLTKTARVATGTSNVALSSKRDRRRKENTTIRILQMWRAAKSRERFVLSVDSSE
jgi:hypothetical protein